MSAANRSYGSHETYEQKPGASGFIPAHGGYRKLLSFQKAEIIYDFTHRFCERFLQRGDRTIDQMVQAARSGKQNILEGSQASGTSKETEIKLVNVARASLEELLEDYRDFLRVPEATIWPKGGSYSMSSVSGTSTAAYAVIRSTGAPATCTRENAPSLCAVSVNGR